MGTLALIPYAGQLMLENGVIKTCLTLFQQIATGSLLFYTFQQQTVASSFATGTTNRFQPSPTTSSWNHQRGSGTLPAQPLYIITLFTLSLLTALQTPSLTRSFTRSLTLLLTLFLALFLTLFPALFLTHILADMAYGSGKYVGTGRGFNIVSLEFVKIFTLYARS